MGAMDPFAHWAIGPWAVFPLLCRLPMGRIGTMLARWICPAGLTWQLRSGLVGMSRLGSRRFVRAHVRRNRISLARLGQSCLGLSWLGLACLGLAWLGLSWLDLP